LDKEKRIVYFGDSVPAVNKTVAVVRGDSEFTDFFRIVPAAEGHKLLIYRKEKRVSATECIVLCYGVKRYTAER
jgi:hypothetical protein